MLVGVPEKFQEFPQDALQYRSQQLQGQSSAPPPPQPHTNLARRLLSASYTLARPYVAPLNPATHLL